MNKINVKRLVTIVCTMLMLLSFTACDKKTNETNNTTEQPTSYYATTTTPVVYDETTSLVNNKVDINEIILRVDFLNFNGYGFAEVTHRGGALIDVIPEETMKNFVSAVAPELAFQKYGQGYEYYFNNIIEYVPEYNYNRLRNGDVINIVAKVTDEFAAYGVTVDAVKQGLGIDFDSVVSYTVSGLMEGINPTDVLTGIEQYVVFEGTSGNISAKVVLPDNYAFDINGFHIYKVGTNQMRVQINEMNYFDFLYVIDDNDLNSGDVTTIKLKWVVLGGPPTYEDLIEHFASKGGFFTDLFKEIVVP